MQIDSNLFSKLKQLKQDPLGETSIDLSSPLIREDHFIIAIDLVNRFAHGKFKKHYLELLERNRESLVNGEELAPFCRDIKDLINSLKYDLGKGWGYEKGKQIKEEVDASFPKSKYQPYFQLKKVIAPLLRPKAAKEFFEKTLADVEKVNMEKIELLVNECLKVQEEDLTAPLSVLINDPSNNTSQ